MFVLLVLLLLLTFLFSYLWQRHHYWSRRGIPSPPANFFTGHLLDLCNRWKLNVFQFQEWTAQYGPYYGVLEGDRKLLVVSDPDMLHDLFVKKFDQFYARRLRALVGDVDDPNNFRVNVFNARGARWKRLRTLSSPSFNVSNLKQILPTVLDSVNETLKLLEQQTNKDVNVYPFVQEFAMDVISRIALGQTESRLFQNEFIHNVREFFEQRHEHWIELASINFPVLLPLVRSLAFKLRLSNAKHFMAIYDLLLKAVQTRKNERAQETDETAFDDGTKRRLDFIDLFLDLETCSVRDHVDGLQNKGAFKVEKQLSTPEVVAMCFVFLAAGYDTTATSIAYVLHSLAVNPEVQERLRIELDENCVGGEPSYDDLQRLTYLDAVVKESLRLYPLAARANSRLCTDTTTLGRVSVQRGEYVAADVLSLHRDPNLWGPDAAHFRPERWLTDQKRHPMAWMPFGAGPRICLGMRLAFLEEKTFLVALLRRFVVQRTPKTPDKPKIFGSLVLTPEAVDVRLVPRGDV